MIPIYLSVELVQRAEQSNEASMVGSKRIESNKIHVRQNDLRTISFGMIWLRITDPM